MKFILFADDTCLQYSFEPNTKIESVLNNELEKVTDWLITNRLSLNVDKSNYLIFSLHNKRDKYNITMNNDKLQEKDYTKYLGIIIDRKLNWKQHVSQTKLRLSKGILYRLRSYVTKSTLISLYFAFIQSNTNYCLLNWGSAPESSLKSITTSLNKAVRVICFKDNRYNASSLFKE